MALFRDRRGKGRDVELTGKEAFGAYNAKTGDKVNPNLDAKTVVTGGPHGKIPGAGYMPGTAPAYRASQELYDRVQNTKVPGAPRPKS